MQRGIVKQLAAIVGREHLTTVREELSCYSYDSTGTSCPPAAVVFPRDTGQVAALMRLADERNIPVVLRGAGSSTTGGALPVPQCLVMVFSRMNRILEIDAENMIAVVEPGVITGELRREAGKYGLAYPPDPASLKFCTIGGNAAECAGGPSAVKYGVTRDYILGLEAVLPGGDIIHTGVRTEKGVVGYDLTRLLVGSEGTLAAITRLTLRLVPLPEAKITLLLECDSISRATSLVSRLLQAGFTPCTLEYMDHAAIEVVAASLPHKLAPETRALLILEFDGTADEVAAQQAAVTAYLEKEPGITFQQATKKQEAEKLWQARRSISPASFRIKPHKISEDVVVPRSRIPDLVRFTEKLAQNLQLRILTFGHAGDGNIHVNIMIDRTNQREYENALQAKNDLFSHVLHLGGTLSGEHGVGTTKAPFLHLEIDEPTLKLMKRLKQLFDPNTILNPGKIFCDPSPSSAEVIRRHDKKDIDTDEGQI